MTIGLPNRTSKAKVDEPEPNNDLPRGYDDPDSPFWTPPELRGYYERSPESDRRRHVRLGGMRSGMGTIEAPGSRKVKDGSGRAVSVPDVRALQIDESSADLALAVHAIACQDARRALNAALQREQYQANRIANLCPYGCGRDGLDRSILARFTLPSGATIVTGCKPCMDEAARIDRELTVEGSSVGSAVRAARGQTEARLA